jgi:predicted Rossmann fold nucleotide-binding protein DprA/Smf involved in DNA uptake
MTEPHQITTVSRRAHAPKGNRTLVDYQDDLRRRFGNLPSWTELARRENAALRKIIGNPTHAKTFSEEHRQAIRDARHRMGEISETAVLDAIKDQPLTQRQIADATGIMIKTVQQIMMRLYTDFRVTKTYDKRIVTWRAI